MEILKKEYWSTSDLILLPLTGLRKSDKVDIKSYLFWRDYSIFEYNLILTIDYNESYQEIREYVEKTFFPLLDKECVILESYEIGKRLIITVDISYWASDIENYLQGKYSLLSKAAKEKIKEYHANARGNVDQYVWVVLYPNKPAGFINDKTPIAYAADFYGLPIESLQERGELGNIYDKTAETLFTEVDEICHIDI